MQGWVTRNQIPSPWVPAVLALAIDEGLIINPEELLEGNAVMFAFGGDPIILGAATAATVVITLGIAWRVYKFEYAASSPPRGPIFTKNNLQLLLMVAAFFAVPVLIEACAGDWLRLWVKPWLQPDKFLSLLLAVAVLAGIAALVCAVLFGLYRLATGSVFGAVFSAVTAAGVVLYGLGIIH